MNTKTLTQMEFQPEDFEQAYQIARRLGYQQMAYTSTSALIGIFCLPENPRRNPQHRPTQGGCIIKTKELGFLFVQDQEDLGLSE